MKRKKAAKNSTEGKARLPFERVCSLGCFLIAPLCLTCYLNAFFLNAWLPFEKPVDERSLMLTSPQQRKNERSLMLTVSPLRGNERSLMLTRPPQGEHERSLMSTRPPHRENAGLTITVEKITAEQQLAYQRKMTIIKYSARENLRNDSVLDLLNRAGILNDLANETIEKIPSGERVQSLYGADVPYIYGMNTCSTFRKQVPSRKAYLGVAGMFNTGTNALAFMLHLNIVMSKKISWQVPWGKHRLASWRFNHTAERFEKLDKTAVLPIVIIKDPLMWMQSMCRSPYSVQWARDPRRHCPNLVPSESDRKRFRRRLKNATAIPVSVKFDEDTVFRWNSLVELWNDWYRQYLQADYPRLIVRYEDLLFYPEAVATLIAHCVGARIRQPPVYHVNTAKVHGSKTDLVGAIIKSGSPHRRTQGMTTEDLEYASQHLDSELMKIFHYRYPLNK